MTAIGMTAKRASYDIEIKDVEYRRDGGKPILAKIFQPKGAGPFPMMIDLHGGAWCNGDRHNDDKLCEAMARAGIITAALDFRMPPVAAYPGSIQDIHYAVRWMKQRSAAMKGNGKVGAVGISSGGHQGMLIGIRPNDPRYAALPLEGGANIDARLGCVVMCWPVIDPIGRFHYAKQVQAAGGKVPEEIDRVIPAGLTYWQTEAAMAEGTPANALENGEKVDLPPVLVVQGTADYMHPKYQLERFVGAYKNRGGHVEVEWYQGELSGFLTRTPVNPKHMADGTERVIAFIHQHLG